MTVNHYINNYTETCEQDLANDLLIEALQFYGFDALYVPRDEVNLDTLYGEDPLKSFTRTYAIEMYCASAENFQGEGDFLQKFGLEIRDQLTIEISMSRFHEVFGDDLARPREGDLIYVPFTHVVFEIKYVDPDKVFYQLGQLKLYTVKVERFVYSSETMDTGISDIDSLEDEYAYAIELVLGSGSGTYTKDEIVYQGSTLDSATATGTVISWDSTGKILKVKNITGEFADTVAVKGNTGTASYTLTSHADDLADIADNAQIEEEAEDIMDYDENNPFSE